MKRCNFEIEASFGLPFDYENWYETMTVELTDEQFNRYCDALRWWEATDEWKNWDIENVGAAYSKQVNPDGHVYLNFTAGTGRIE